ncbi:MAG: VacJ family lipoprotein [Desulfobacteraceae bacterium]|jgi:phospholipid-binding lipoprotein MlaA|nr:MAG: VacJ family lipoprotein [Desulfobacteraceae bacterium]
MWRRDKVLGPLGMKRKFFSVILVCCFFSLIDIRLAWPGSLSPFEIAMADSKAPHDHDEEYYEEVEDEIYDPIEPFNRAMFVFNDRLYFWVLKPVAEVYNEILPEPLRVSIRNFFLNLLTPVRAVNCLLQGKIDGFGTELGRFLINTTMGVYGFGDAAAVCFDIRRRDEDLGQTIGLYGVGPGIYICWPVFGPSSIRDTIGMVGDGFLNPLYFWPQEAAYRAGISGLRVVNSTSLDLGEYESIKKAALDAYVALRDGYHQYRKNKIKD